MIIEKLEIEGFKSYKEKTILKNFGKTFNAITGKNGSGKSNIIDSICFFLGLSNTNLIRASKIQDLIYLNGNKNSNLAQIILTLKNIKVDKKDKMYGKIIIVSRQVFKNGKNRYLLDGLNVSPGKILNFFYSINLNVNNPHFLIRQGHISNVTFMSYVELFEMLENSMGTKLYEVKKKMAHISLKKKKKNIIYINHVLNKKIKPLIQKFKQFSKKSKKLRFYGSKNNKFSILINRIKITLLNEKIIKSKNEKVSFSRNILTSIVRHDIYLRSIENKKIKNKKTLEKLVHLIKFKKNYLLFWIEICKLINFHKILVDFERIELKCKKIFVLENKKREKMYLQKFLFLNLNYCQKSFFEERKKTFKNLNENKLFKVFSEIKNNFPGFISIFVKSSFERFFYINLIILKKITNHSKYNFKDFLILYKLQIYIFTSCIKSIEYFSKYSLKKIFSFFKEDLTNFYHCFERICMKKNQKIWNERKLIFGIALSVLQVKISYLTNAFETVISNKINIFLIKNQLIINRIFKILQIKNKDNFFSENKCKFVSIKESIPKLFGIISLIGVSEIFIEFLNEVKSCFLLIDIDDFKKNISMPLESHYFLINFFGDGFRSTRQMFFFGCFNLKYNYIFDRIQLQNYILMWIRSCSIERKKNLRKKFKRRIIFSKNKFKFLKKNFFLKISKHYLFFSNKKSLKNKKNFFYTMKIIKISIEKNFFLLKLKNFNQKFFEFNKIYIPNSPKTLIKLYNDISVKVNYFDYFFYKKIKNIRFDFFIFWTKFMKFFIIIFILKKKRIFDYISNFYWEPQKKKFLNSDKILNFKQLNSFRKSNLNTKKFSEQLIYLRKALGNFYLNLKKYFKSLLEKPGNLYKEFEKNLRVEFFNKISLKYDNFLFKRIKIEKDRLIIEEIISRLDYKKKEILALAFKKINNSFKTIFNALIPLCCAKILVIKNKSEKWIGIKFKIFVNNIQKKSIELSGGQKSILALSFIFSLLVFKPAPFYILDEVDAALDLCYSKNVSRLIFQNFSFAQFIIISLKKQIILDAEVIFEIKKVNEASFVTRLKKKF
jgi:ABC-type cobalamin/Fe3+-siderophores transport system ATPase subunit